MKFKTRMINAAVAAALGTVAGAAQAVNLGNDGEGQVLIYPYYTTQSKAVPGGGSGAFNTLFSIVNSDSVNGKAVKVRFLEAKGSVEVLDFNLYLSPNDMWSAAITRDGSGNALLRTTDNSCTAPEIPVVSTVGTVVTREIGFVNLLYATDAVKDASMARAKEGYAEIIQMADLSVGDGTANTINLAGLDTFTAAKHINGVPPNCAAIRTSWQNGSYGVNGNIGVNFPSIPGSLSGATTYINVGEGTDSSTDAVALEEFTVNKIHFAPGDIQPNLSKVNPSVSAVMQNSNLVVTDWAASIPAVLPVSAVLMRDSIINEYAVAAAPVGLTTDWVVTMPTKNFHVLQPVFKAPFTSSFTTTGACEAMTLIAYDREETSQTNLNFSPQGPNQICWEANVLTFNSGSSLGAVNTVKNVLVPYSAGWLRMSFGQSVVAPAGNTTRVFYFAGAPFVNQTGPYQATYFGLPVVGFADMVFLNLSSLAAYGTAYTHRYTRRITP
jgi:hypothetical protein